MSAFSFLLATIFTISTHAGPLCATLSWHHWNQDNGGGKYYITPHCQPGSTWCSEKRDLKKTHWDNNASGFKVEKYCFLEMWCGGTYPLKGYDSFDFPMESPYNDYIWDPAWHGPMKVNLGGRWNDCLSGFRCSCNFPSIDAIPADFHGGRRRAEDAETEVSGSAAPEDSSSSEDPSKDPLEEDSEAEEGVIVDYGKGSLKLSGSVSMEALRAAIEKAKLQEAPGFVYDWDQTEIDGLHAYEDSHKA